MNEIPELCGDLAFLKKFDSRNKVWKEYDTGCAKKGKEKIQSNFLLHPKRFSSDSECSSITNTPRELCSGTFVNEPNNNEQKASTSINWALNSPETCCVESGIGDGDLKTSTTKTLLKKTLKSRPNSFRVDNFDKKFKSLIERSLKSLTNIRTMIEQGIPPADGEEDYHRRQKRLQEFSSRFSRIYLYPLTCLIEELSLPEKLSLTVLNQKLLSALQTVVQALQAYYTHLPSSVDKCGSDKLKSVLDQILYLCQVYELRKDSDSENWEFVNALRKHVELLLEAITNFDMRILEMKQQEIKKKTSALIKPKIEKKTKSKLSMYTMNYGFKKQLEYRNRVELLTKKKYCVKSRYKVAGFKHRPPVVKPAVEAEQCRLKLIRKCSSSISKDTPKNSPVRDEDIKTLVEMHSEVETALNVTEDMIHENSTASSKPQLVQDNDFKIENENEKINVEKALDVLRKFFESSNENKPAEFLEKIASEIDKKKETNRKEPIITAITGAKNAKLICIRDDNSLEEEPSRFDKEMMTDVEVQIKSSETQTDMKSSKSKTKISRLPNNRKLLTLLPKEYAINIIQYKLRYNHFHKHNPMYRKSVQIQPCVLMGQISDGILDFILKSITNELEVNEILENLYHAEFQY